MDLPYSDVKVHSRTGAASGPWGTDAEMFVPILPPLSPTGRLSPCRAQTTEWPVPWARLEFLLGTAWEVVLQRAPRASEGGCRVVSWGTAGTQGVCNTQYRHSVHVPSLTAEEGERSQTKYLACLHHLQMFYFLFSVVLNVYVNCFIILRFAIKDKLKKRFLQSKSSNPLIGIYADR